MIVGCKNTTIPDGVMYIGYGAFKDCTGLTNIIIPNSVTHIDNEAFRGCTGLTDITIPDNVTNIGRFAFYGCNNLNSVCVISENTVIDKDEFSENDYNMQILAPKDSSVYNVLKRNYNVIPYSFTVNKDDKDKPMLALDGKVVLTEDMWSCICRLVKDTDVQYIYFKEFDFGDMMPEDIVADFDKSDFNYKQVVFSIEKDGETIRLGSIAEKSSFQIFIDMLVDAFSFVLDSVISGIKGIISSIRNWWK